MDKPVKNLIKDGIEFTKYLEGRHPPLDTEAYKDHVEKVTKKAIRQCGVREDTEDYEENFYKNRNAINKKFNELLRKQTYHWKSINYNQYMSLIYLVSRTAPEYAVICRVFNEIFSRDKTFQPKSLFDFGSGVGTVSWAAKRYWKNSLKEFFCVDSSSHMNDIAQALLQDGKLNLEIPKGVFFRQFLPSKNELYDLVVTAYTLFELPSKQARLEAVLNLWSKTGKYLVIVERGSNAGFKLVNEARDFLRFRNESSAVPSLKAHIFAPCPHDLECPRLMEDNTPCNFMVNYKVLAMDNKERISGERFSYVIFKKGEREDFNQWPRIVRPVIKRSGHSICRVCTAEGKLKEVIFTAAKHGKIPYLCARNSRWGDILPVKLDEKEAIVDDKEIIKDIKDSDSENEDDEHERKR
ncbi:ribosome assembly protein METTL17, mitochondrial isoform X2 [Lycorma delicatula]|uniref:ribosome assembly protein METTL17, mitochondrial isoform X2 n=1 Tax=Lycorma delicatula TaxID=130591 RepID=UPI003F516104